MPQQNSSIFFFFFRTVTISGGFATSYHLETEQVCVHVRVRVCVTNGNLMWWKHQLFRAQSSNSVSEYGSAGPIATLTSRFIPSGWWGGQCILEFQIRIPETCACSMLTQQIRKLGLGRKEEVFDPRPSFSTLSKGPVLVGKGNRFTSQVSWISTHSVVYWLYSFVFLSCFSTVLSMPT